MNLARFSVNRPVAAGIISAALFLMGLYFVSKMPVSLYPEVSFPYVSVVVPLPGASAEQIEKKIVKPLEKELAAIKGVKRVIAHIRPGYANVVLAFKMSTNDREAVDNTRERVAKLRSTFPKDTKEPIVSRVDIGATPVIIYGIASSKSPSDTKKQLDDGLVRDLQRVDGVSEAEVVGLGDEQVEIDLDPAKLAALRIAPLDVYQQLAAFVATVPWGDVRQDGQIIAISRAALPAEPAFWSAHELTLADGRNVRLGEIGTARVTREEDAAQVHINGKPGLGLVVTKRADANTLDVVKRVQAAVAAYDTKDAKLFPIIDQSSYIEENAHEVWIALFAGGAFAVLVILVFLTDVRSALITATALPVSVTGTFIFMSYLGFSINMMSLLALALAIGLLIDDAVVVREAIFSEMEAGKTAKEAAVSGTDKVSAAVLATTLAVIAVFVPVSAMEGMVGQFFKEFGLTIVVAVTLSLWVAFTLDPMLSARFGGSHKPLQGRVWDAVRASLTKIEVWAAALAARAFAKPLPVIVGSAALLALSLGLVLSRGADFLAFEDRGQLVVSIAAPVGSPQERSAQLADEAYKRMQGLEGLTDVYATVGGDDARKTEMRLVFTSKTQRKKGLLTISHELGERLKDLGGEVLVMEPPPIEGVGKEAPLAIYVYGEDFPALYTEATRVAGEVRKVSGVSAVRLESQLSSPGFDVKLNDSELGYQGTNANAVEMTGRLALTGMEAGNVGADNLKMLVRYGQGDRSLNKLWDDTFVPTGRGPVLLSSLATSQPSQSPGNIDREKRSRKVVIWGSLDRSRSYGNVIKDIERVLATVQKPISAEVAGDKELFDEMTSNFAIAIIGSAFFIFIILAIQFENLVRPFVILLSLPLAVIGAFLGLFVTGEKLALGSLIGIILLIGLAAKNGILLVDAIGHKEKAMKLADAVAASVKERFRPILMTSVAMIFGMLPTALMRGGGSEFRAPMAIAIIGGVVSSTLLSVLVVPAAFGLIARISAFASRRKTMRTGMLAKAASLLLIGALAVTGTKAKAESAPSPSAAASAPSSTAASPTGSASQSAAAALPTGPASPSAASAPTGSASPSAAAALTAPAHTTVVTSLTPKHAADMRQVLQLINPTPRPDSKEDFAIRAADEAADGLTSSSAKPCSAASKARRPATLPSLASPIPSTSPCPLSLAVPLARAWWWSPKSKTSTPSAGRCRLFNLQVLKSLTVAARSREQREAVHKVERETTARTKIQLLLQYELAQKARHVRDEQVAVATSRLATATAHVTAGIGRRSQQSEAAAALEAAKSDLAAAEADVQRLRVEFQAQSGQTLPADGLGLPTFPYTPAVAFAPNALVALDGVAGIHEAASRAAEAAFAPTVDLDLGHKQEVYDGAPQPQNSIGISLSWTLLDAGARRRNTSDERRAMFQAQSDAADMRLSLKTAYDTLATREGGARHSLAARQAAAQAAEEAVQDAVAAYSSGTGRLLDVRLADEQRFGAELGVYQAEIELQAIAVDSLVLTGTLLPYIEAGSR